MEPKMRPLALAWLAVATSLVQAQALAQQQHASLPPPAASLAHLAKSPASTALLTDFFAREQKRAPGLVSVPPSALHSKNYIIVPVVNPDGYAYTWTHNRMWRKNRSRSPSSKCIGLNPFPLLALFFARALTLPRLLHHPTRIRPQTDLNRNFDHSFGGQNSTADPCSHIYSGAFPFSEPETRALANLLWSLKDRIKFYLTIHSYNQLWACPYAHTTEPPTSLGKHMRVLRSIQRAVQEAEGVQYEIGPLSTSLYVGSGFGIDFAYDKCKIEHSYLVELRDKGAHGFILPADQILPTARETLAGLRAGLKVVFGGVQ